MSLEYTFPLRGANFRPPTAKELVIALQAGDTVTLVAEPENPYDANAIQVVASDEHIGYVAREIAETMIDDFNNADTYSCVVDYFIDPLTPVFLLKLDFISNESNEVDESDEVADEAA